MPTGVYDRSKAKFNSGLFKKGIRPSRKTEFRKGDKPWNKGLPLAEGTKIKLSSVLEGKKPWNKGKECSYSKGSLNPRWNGGRRIHGYVYIKMPNHPFVNQDGYVREHRLVVEKALGRYLTKKEVVHHIDKNKINNKVENLMVFSSEAIHRRFERGELVDAKDIIFDGSSLKEMMPIEENL